MCAKKVGMPVLKLDRKVHTKSMIDRHPNSGGLYGVLAELDEDRITTDPDYNPELTPYNRYYVFNEDLNNINYKDYEELGDYYKKRADEYILTDSSGKQRKLRSDAGVAFVGIIKPNVEFMNSLEYEEQMKFLEESLEVVREIYKKRGLQIDIAFMHVDEGNPHIHYVGMDPEYKMQKKLKLPLYRELNHTTYIQAMRSKGYDIEPLNDFLEDIKDMNEEQIKEYKSERIEERKHKSGLTSKQYKANKDLIKQYEQMEREENIQKAINNDLDHREHYITLQERIVKKQREELNEREEELNEREEELNKREEKQKIERRSLSGLKQGLNNKSTALDLKEKSLAEREKSINKEIQKQVNAHKEQITAQNDVLIKREVQIQVKTQTEQIRANFEQIEGDYKNWKKKVSGIIDQVQGSQRTDLDQATKRLNERLSAFQDKMLDTFYFENQRGYDPQKE